VVGRGRPGILRRACSGSVTHHCLDHSPYPHPTQSGRGRESSWRG
jgi:hypothetical protein